MRRRVFTKFWKGGKRGGSRTRPLHRRRPDQGARRDRSASTTPPVAAPAIRSPGRRRVPDHPDPAAAVDLHRTFTSRPPTPARCRAPTLTPCQSTEPPPGSSWSRTSRVINQAVARPARGRGLRRRARPTTARARSRSAPSADPDLVVLDVMLPGFDGHEVCRRIQADRPVPVLMLTARDDEADLLVGLGVGADDYLTKPFRMRELVARVRRPAAPGRARRELAARRPATLTVGDLVGSTRRPAGCRGRGGGAPDADRVRPAGLPGRQPGRRC